MKTKIAIVFFVLSFFSVAYAQLAAYELRNQNSGKCLDDDGWSLIPGAAIIQWDCTGQPNQKWVFERLDDGNHQIRNLHSNMCIDVEGWNSANGTRLIQWPCTGLANQRWKLEASHGGVQAVSVFSQRCLEIGGWSTANGSQANQWDCSSGQPNQVWLGPSAPSPSPSPAVAPRLLVNQFSGRCGEALGWSRDPGSGIGQWDCSGLENQQWKVNEVTPGFVQIQNVFNQLCLDVEGWNPANGARVIQWNCSGLDNQLWQVRASGRGQMFISKLSGRCLETGGWSRENGATLSLWDCTEAQYNQVWLSSPELAPPPAEYLSQIDPSRSFEGKVTQLMDGSLLAAFNHEASDERGSGQGITTMTSFDQGQTWTNSAGVSFQYHRADQFATMDPQVLALAGPAGGQNTCVDMSNPHPIQLKHNPELRGAILIAFRHRTYLCGQPPSQDLRSWSIHRLVVVAKLPSENFFRFHSTIEAREAVEGLWEPILLERPDGKLHVYYSNEYFTGASLVQRIEQKVSTDGGRSWGGPSIIADTGRTRDGMPVVADLGGGHLMVAFESNDGNNGGFMIHQSHSFHDGAPGSWSGREDVFRPPAGRQAGAPAITRTNSGRVIVGFQTDMDYPGACPSPDYSHCANFQYVMSLDQGRSFGARQNIEGGLQPSGAFQTALWNFLYTTAEGRTLGLSAANGVRVRMIPVP